MASLEERIEGLEQLLDVLLADIRETRNAISNGFTKIDENFGKIGEDFLKVHEKIDNLSNKTHKSLQNVDKTLESVDYSLVSIKDEISKISSVTRYEEEYNNLKAIHGGKTS